jgi:hypothetical protein
MRDPLITSAQALLERLRHQGQVVDESAPEATMPPYMESFLAHLRLLVGVPFNYLIPDARLLPDESIRFFYLDRSWTDRLVDGAVAVGKIGTREQAHHQAQHPTVQRRLDVTERSVRMLQRGQLDFAARPDAVAGDPQNVVTGFVLRSAAVSGWPAMDVRAFRRVLTRAELAARPALANDPANMLQPLRIERLSPSVLFALFDGVPELVWLEEPHHGVQFGVQSLTGRRGLFVYRRSASGEAEETRPPVELPVRAANHSVVAIADLRRRLHQAWLDERPSSTITRQSGSAALAIEVLQPPWRQRFEGTRRPEAASSWGEFAPSLAILREVSTLDAESLSRLVEVHP